MLNESTLFAFLVNYFEAVCPLFSDLTDLCFLHIFIFYLPLPSYYILLFFYSKCSLAEKGGIGTYRVQLFYIRYEYMFKCMTLLSPSINSKSMNTYIQWLGAVPKVELSWWNTLTQAPVGTFIAAMYILTPILLNVCQTSCQTQLCIESANAKKGSLLHHVVENKTHVYFCCL